MTTLNRTKDSPSTLRKARGTARTIDEYLAGVNAVDRAALGRLRTLIKAAAPTVEEVISYGLPAFKLNGRVLVGFGAAVHHCAFYPWSGSTVRAHQALLKG